MITRSVENDWLWQQLAAKLPEGVISWRQDGRAVQRDGKYFARFVAYIEANTVRERLDGVIPGEWNLTLELLPALGGDGSEDATCSFKARLQILGVMREDVGTGRDYKQAATDAFKRAAVRFGIGHELYAYEQNWVQVDGDGKFAKAIEDPSEAYARRLQRKTSGAAQVSGSGDGVSPRAAAPVSAPSALPHAQTATNLGDDRSCPKCGGRMFDNRVSKRNPKAPDFKCKSRSCDGVIWPAKAGAEVRVDAARSSTSFSDGPEEDYNTLGSDEIPY